MALGITASAPLAASLVSYRGGLASVLQSELITALAAAGLRERVKIMVGGAPVNDEYARHIGADGYSPDASQAVNLAKSLMTN